MKFITAMHDNSLPALTPVATWLTGVAPVTEA